jgi:small subunit ribosomal protein S20
LANSKQAAKRARQSIKRHARNASQKTRMRTEIKQLLVSLRANEIEKATQQFTQLTSVLDRLAKKRLIHQNRADRLKHRLNKRIKATQSAA